jgi:HlyD family secretion protein
MKKIIITLAIVVVAGVGLFIFGGVGKNLSGQQATPEAKPTVSGMKAEDKVTSEGKVVPVKSALLSLPVGGIAVEVPVAEGAEVQAGQLLLRLDARQQEAAVAQAEATLQRAQAQLDQLRAGPRPEEIAAAEAAVESAQAALQRLRQGPDDNQLIAARAEVANAEAALKQAQTAYDRAGGAANPYAGMLPTSLQLEQATNAYIAAKARYDALQKGPRAAEVEAAQADIRRAQAQLDLIKAGARPETIAAAESDVAASNAALAQAKIALTNTELHAPFAGEIVVLDVKVGEQVIPGTPVVNLADCSAWQIETSDLTELNVVGLREGSPATVTFDAVSGLELAGTVSRIKMLGESKQGDIVYTVVVKPERMDERLRWNMTAQVSIKAQ